MKERSYGIIPLKYDGTNWHVFLVKLASGNHWGFPKGHINEGEMPMKTAARELKEETNLEVLQWLNLPELQETYHIKRQSVEVEKTVTYYPARVTADEPIQLAKGEILDGKWIEVKHAKGLITYEASKSIAKQLEELLETYHPEKL